MLPSLLIRLASAAPWPVDIVAQLPQVPAQVAVYAPLVVDPEPRLTVLEDAFAVAGATTWIPGRDVAFAADGGRFVWAWGDGGIAFHDDTANTECPMQVREDDEVWSDADSVLADLDLLDASPFALAPLRIARSEATITNPMGRTFGPWTTSQMAAYSLTLDGYPVFGPGGETTLEFDDRGVIAVSDAQRDLELLEMIVPDSPAVALQRWMRRAGVEHRWSVLRSYVHDIERVRIDDVRLGYFVPASGAEAKTIEPVYQIHGIAIGHDAQGGSAAVQVLWWEPVRADRSIPSLNLFLTKDAQ